MTKQDRAELRQLRTAEKKITTDAHRAAKARNKLAAQIKRSAHRALARLTADERRADHATHKHIIRIQRRIGIVTGRLS